MPSGLNSQNHLDLLLDREQRLFFKPLHLAVAAEADGEAEHRSHDEPSHPQEYIIGDTEIPISPAAGVSGQRVPQLDLGRLL